MSRNYKFHNPQGVYFVSFSVINWLDVFTNGQYTDILLNTIRYSQLNKGMELYAWCIMPTHVHLIFRSTDEKYKPELILGDLKRYSSRQIVKAISENPKENKKDWLLEQFRKAALKTSNVNKYQFWQHNNHPIELWSPKVFVSKIHYIHNNPVQAGLVAYPEDYIYSSAKDYSGEKGLLDVVLIY